MTELGLPPVSIRRNCVNFLIGGFFLLNIPLSFALCYLELVFINGRLLNLIWVTVKGGKRDTPLVYRLILISQLSVHSKSTRQRLLLLMFFNFVTSWRAVFVFPSLNCWIMNSIGKARKWAVSQLKVNTGNSPASLRFLNVCEQQQKSLC